MQHATEPSDVLWKNMKGQRGLHFMRRILVSGALLVIIFFVSSPAVILFHVRELDRNNLLDWAWTEKLPFGTFFHQQVGPLFIVFINLVIL